VALASCIRARAEEVARRYRIARVHDTPEALIEDPAVEIVDLAFPPDQQPGLIRHALRQPHLKAILAQKPLALSLGAAIALYDQAAAAGKIVSVNQNMRYDQSMRVRHGAGALGRRQRQDDGAGRGRLPLDRRGSRGRPCRDSDQSGEGGRVPMMQLGIFTGYFPYGLEETAKRVRALDFNTVQLDLHFKDLDLGPGQVTRDKCIRIRETFRDHNLPICCVSGYTNIVHPDPAERERRNGHRKEIIRHAQFLGSPYVISETAPSRPIATGSRIPRTGPRKAGRTVAR
jgi:hypothetical protein